MKPPLRCAALLLAAHAVSAPAAVFSIPAPTADAFVSSNPAPNAATPTPTAAIKDSNYGGAGALGVAAVGKSKGEFDSVLRFDLTSAKALFNSTYGAGNWTVTGATLQLTATPPGNAIFNGFQEGPGSSNVNTAGAFSIGWMQNDSWVEGAGTPNGPSLTGINYSTLSSFISGADQSLGTFNFGGSTSSVDTWTLGLPAAFVSDIQSDSLLSLLMTPADANVAYLFNSRSVGTAASRPILTIIAVPEPGAAALLAVGALLAVLRRPPHARAA